MARSGPHGAAVLRAALLKNKETVSDVIAPTISLKLPAWCTWPCTPAALETEQCLELIPQQILAPINPQDT